MTPYDLITLALKQATVLGEGQTASAETVNDSFSLLNMMLAQWARKRWLVYQLVDVPVTSTGAQSYVVGLGQAVNITRPDRIEAAYARNLQSGALNQVDIQLEVLPSYEDYIAIPLKTQKGPPSVVFYDPGYPTGKLYFWPVPPSGQWELHILLKQVLPSFLTLRDTVQLPAEYQEALLYNLAVRLAANFGRQTLPQVPALAAAALNTVRAANATIPSLRMPDALVDGIFDVYSGSWR